MDISNLKHFVETRLYSDFPAHMPYHSIRHVIDVYESVTRIADDEGVSIEEKELLQAAALLHDYGFIECRDGHEEVSCKYARHFLPQFGFNEAKINTICSLITATKIGHKPTSTLEKIIMDADLEYLGRDDFDEIVNLLYQELSAVGIITNAQQWVQFQLNFLKTHKFQTHSAIKMREHNKQKQITILEQSLLK